MQMRQNGMSLRVQQSGRELERVLDELHRGPTGREGGGAQLTLVETRDDVEGTFALRVEECEQNRVSSGAVRHADVLSEAAIELPSG